MNCLYLCCSWVLQCWWDRGQVWYWILLTCSVSELSTPLSTIPSWILTVETSNEVPQHRHVSPGQVLLEYCRSWESWSRRRGTGVVVVVVMLVILAGAVYYMHVHSSLVVAGNHHLYRTPPVFFTNNQYEVLLKPIYDFCSPIPGICINYYIMWNLFFSILEFYLD